MTCPERRIGLDIKDSNSQNLEKTSMLHVRSVDGKELSNEHG